MDQVKIGKFILNLRKKNNLTQAEFADILNVTSQAVSKWENGRGIPDIEMLKKISEEFNVDIKDILDGEERIRKSNKKNKYYIIIIVIFLCLGLFFIYKYLKGNNEYKFSPLTTTSSDFSITGAAAYSKDKRSIYISNIKYKNDESSDDKYFTIECVLYEENNNIEEKISQSGDINNYNENNSYTLSELLQNINFNVEDYSSSCKDLADHQLYLIISALDTSKKIITFKIPLSLEGSCK